MNKDLLTRLEDECECWNSGAEDASLCTFCLAADEIRMSNGQIEGMAKSVHRTIEEVHEYFRAEKDELTKLNEELMGIIAEQGYEIDRLRTIIRNYYVEQVRYDSLEADEFNNEIIIPQSWKDAYGAFRDEAWNIENGRHDQ